MKNYITEHLRVYGVPSGTPSRIGVFSVTVNGLPLGLVTERNLWEKPCSFGVFDMDAGHPVTVSIRVEDPFETAALYPLSEGITLIRSGDTLTYTVDRPVNALTLVLDSDYTKEALHIFSNPIDHDAPTESGENLLYVAPGYHNLSAYGGTKPDLPYTSDGTLSLPSGMTLYVAGGAVIDGMVRIIGDNVTVRGSGILMKGEDCAVQSPKSSGICLVAAEAKHVRIENVICHAHRWHNWTVHFWHSEDIFVDRIKVFSPVYASTDGIDISNSSDVTVKNSFIRACDDAVAIKGLYGSDHKPQDCLPIRHILFEHCVLWNDCNNCMGIGQETRASVFEDITFRDIDVIFSYDDRDNHEKLDERSVMNVCSLHATYFRNILWEDIRVNTCHRLLCLTFRDDFWFGSIPGDQTTPGGMQNITCRNVTVTEKYDSSIFGEILMSGREDKYIDDVTLENINICGEQLKSYVPGEYVRNLQIR